MRAWWSVLFVPQSRTHLHRSCDCSLLCLEEPITNSASGPPFSLSLRISSSFLEMSSYAWSQVTRFHLPPSSFIGYFRRCESCVMPCSRIEAPFAQCAPRFSGESNTGSCRIQTPFCTTPSIEQPTEQCVHTVRLTSILPLVCSSFASALPSIENGSCEATAAPPTPTPERLRNVRRSIVLTSTPESPRERRPCGAAVLVALRVISMAVSSDLGRAVVVVHVLALLVAARSTLIVGRRSGLGGRRLGRHDCRGSCRAAGAKGQQEIASRETIAAVAHETPPSI